MDNEELLSLLPNREAEEDPRVEEEPAAPETEVEAAPAEAEAEPQPEGPARGPDGKFVSKAEPEAGYVPLPSLLDERDKRQKAESARDAFERQLRELQAKATPPEQPDPNEVLQQALYAQNLRASRRFAEREYGKDVIGTVHEWAAARCDADPIFNQQMRSSDDPYEAAYQAYQREQVLAEVQPSELEAFKAWKAAQAAAPADATPIPQATPAPAPTPPKSLANAPGNGAAGKDTVPTYPGAAFASAIPR